MTEPILTLITPGGGRQKSFELCEKYMKRQTIWGKIPIQWIVADDNKADPLKCSLGQEHIFGALPWKPGFNTLRYNLAAAVPLVKGQFVAIVENDDYFRSNYLEVYLEFLKHCDLIGSTNVTYYSLKSPRGFKEMKNFQHASTTQTAFRKSYLPHFERAIHSGEQYFDLFLWGAAHRFKHKFILFHGMDLCVGMKCVPGRGGIGCGHTDNDFIADPNFIKLKQLVGPEDAQPYIEMCK